MIIDVNFKNYGYYPLLHTRNSEEDAFLNLSNEDKLAILPSFVLHNRKGSALNSSLDRILGQYDGKFILFPPISEKILNHISQEEKKLFDSSQHYENWQKFTAQYENAIPAIINENEKYQRDITRQALNLERRKGKVAFRVRNIQETSRVINAISALDDPQNAIIFIDCGYISDLTDSYNISNLILQTFKKEFEKLNVISLSTSFPSSPAGEMNELSKWSTNQIKVGSIQQRELTLYLKLSEKYEILYGDYASIYPIPIESKDSEGRWSARIDFATDEEFWGVCRMPTEHGEGYQKIASYIVEKNMINSIPECWGKEQIINASKGQVFGKSPAKWVGVRANTHMSRQIFLTSSSDEPEQFS